MKIFIRPARYTDANFISCLRGQEAVYSNLTDPNLYSADDTEQWLKGLNPDRRFIVEVTHTEEPGISAVKFGCADREVQDSQLAVFHDYRAGYIRLDRVDYLNKNCFIGLDLDANYRGRGIGTAVYEFILPYLFNFLNMHRIYLLVLDTNEPAKRLYVKLGFREIGRYDEAILRNGRYIDYVLMSKSADEDGGKTMICTLPVSYTDNQDEIIQTFGGNVRTTVVKKY